MGFARFSWLNKNKSSKSTDNKEKSTSCSKYSNSKKRKGSAHKRLYKQIKDSLDKEKSQDASKIMFSNLYKFHVNNISIILNNMNISQENKTETNWLTNYSAIKTKNEINQNNNNKSDKINNYKKHKIQSSFNELEKRKNIVNVKKMSIYNKKTTNTITVKNPDKNMLKLNSEKTKGFNHIIIPKIINNVNKIEDYNNNSNNIKHLRIKYYKTLRERNEIKKNAKDRKSRNFSVFNNPTIFTKIKTNNLISFINN